MAASKGDSLVIGGQNVCSLLNKKNLVEKLIRKNKLDILVVGESMLRESTTPRRQGITSDPLHIDDYTYVRQDRYFIKKNASGGLIVYIREGIEFKKRSDWEWPENNTQFVEISITEPTRFDLVAIYSPPRSGHAQYVIDLTNFFLERNKELYIPVMFVGDLNIDPARPTDKVVKTAFKQFKDQFGARQLITAATRMENCIDHIIIAIPEQDMGSVDAKVVKTVRKVSDPGYISDHQLVLCSVKKSPQPATLSISQPKECGDINLMDLVKDLIGYPQTKYISLKMICEFSVAVDTKDIEHPGYINIINTSDQSISFHFKMEESKKVKPILTEVDKLITEIKDNNDQAGVVTKQCTICIVHKQTKSLHMSDKSKPWSVGGVDCFLINCSADQIPKVEPFLHKFHVCNQTDCFELFHTEPNIKHHKMLMHFYCPYCDELEPFNNSEELNKHIDDTHPHICDYAVCMKKFANNTQLNEHIEKHENLNSDDKKCKKCDDPVSYDSQEQLTYHYASKHFICIECPKQLRSKQSAVNHLNTKHSITWCPDQCCRKYFTTAQGLQDHQKHFNHK